MAAKFNPDLKKCHQGDSQNFFPGSLYKFSNALALLFNVILLHICDTLIIVNDENIKTLID
jgi:hypothetical protein